MVIQKFKREQQGKKPSVLCLGNQLGLLTSMVSFAVKHGAKSVHGLEENEGICTEAKHQCNQRPNITIENKTLKDNTSGRATTRSTAQLVTIDSLGTHSLKYDILINEVFFVNDKKETLDQTSSRALPHLNRFANDQVYVIPHSMTQTLALYEFKDLFNLSSIPGAIAPLFDQLPPKHETDPDDDVTFVYSNDKGFGLQGFFGGQAFTQLSEKIVIRKDTYDTIKRVIYKDENTKKETIKQVLGEQSKSNGNCLSLTVPDRSDDVASDKCKKQFIFLEWEAVLFFDSANQIFLRNTLEAMKHPIEENKYGISFASAAARESYEG